MTIRVSVTAEGAGSAALLYDENVETSVKAAASLKPSATPVTLSMETPVPSRGLRPGDYDQTQEGREAVARSARAGVIIDRGVDLFGRHISCDVPHLCTRVVMTFAMRKRLQLCLQVVTWLRVQPRYAQFRRQPAMARSARRDVAHGGTGGNDIRRRLQVLRAWHQLAGQGGVVRREVAQVLVT